MSDCVQGIEPCKWKGKGHQFRIKDNGGVVVKQQSANNPDADKMWRRSSDQTMTLMMSVLLVIKWMWQINTELIAKASVAKVTINAVSFACVT